MSYHDLSSCTLSAGERAVEASNIVDILEENLILSKLSDSEIKFVAGLVKDSFNYVSVKQLFWLRDIKDKYL